jgi:hypothetical protein
LAGTTLYQIHHTGLGATIDEVRLGEDAKGTIAMDISFRGEFQNLLCREIDASRNDSEHDRSRIVHVSFHNVPHELDVRLGSHALGGTLEDAWDVDDTEVFLFRARDFQTKNVNGECWFRDAIIVVAR